MIFPVEIAEAWAARYGMEIPKAVCLKCKQTQEFTIPFAYGDFRGLISSHTECGEEFRQSVFVLKDPEDRKALGEFVTNLALQGKQDE